MKIVKHSPAARGVSQLMYVGDDVAPVAPSISLTTVALVIAGAWLLFGRK